MNAIEREPSCRKKKRKHHSLCKKKFRIVGGRAFSVELLVFLVDVEDGAVFVESYVEGFSFFDEDVAELVFLS